jgi:hypothetical protein
MSRPRNYNPDAFAASGGPALHTELTSIIEQIRGLYSQALDVVGAMDGASLAHLAGYPSLEAFLVGTQRVSRRHARQLVSHAGSVRETVTPTGHHQPAALPTVRAALAEGVLDPDHVEEIVKAVADIPAWASGQARELVETTLVAEARTADPGCVRAVGKELVARIDQDGRPPREEELAEPANSFRYHRTSAGRMRFTGNVEPETAELLDAMLSPLSKPQPVSDTIPDQRSMGQRLGDGFCAVVHAAAHSSDQLPGEGGQRPTINVTVDYEKLVAGIGHATFELGDPIPTAAVRRLACDAHLIPMVLGTDSVPLDLGRTHRLVTPRLRRALIARDRGCAMPGCTLRARWCDAHHLRAWLDGGATDINNLVLLCRRHHRLIEHSAWEVRIINGVPEFLPPAYLDPNRAPLHNTLRRHRE